MCLVCCLPSVWCSRTPGQWRQKEGPKPSSLAIGISIQLSQKRLAWPHPVSCPAAWTNCRGGFFTQAPHVSEDRADTSDPLSPLPTPALEQVPSQDFWAPPVGDLPLPMDKSCSSCHRGWQPQASTGLQTWCPWTWPWNHCGLCITAILAVLRLLLARLPWLALHWVGESIFAANDQVPVLLRL